MANPARTFEDLIVWQKAHAMVLSIYRVSSQFPKEEIFGLTSQIRRAAVSVTSNIVEGFNRNGIADKLNPYILPNFPPCFYTLRLFGGRQPL